MQGIKTKVPVGHSLERKTAALSTKFGRDMLRRWYGSYVAEIILDELPTYRSGPRQGEPKGYIQWRTEIVYDNGSYRRRSTDVHLASGRNHNRAIIGSIREARWTCETEDMFAVRVVKAIREAVWN